MASQIVIHPRSETLADSDSSPHITVTASQSPESLPPVHTLTDSSDSLGTSIVIIESIENPPSIKPAPMNRVIAISAPVPESSIKLINELQEAQTTSIQDVLQIVESNKAEKRAVEAESNTGVFRCDNCDYSSNNRHYLKQHVDLVHNAGRPYKCPYCDYAGKRNHSLREHLVVHSNERPYECNHCNATFRKKGHLTNHVKLHASPKVVKCSLCGIALSGQSSFMDHLKSFHKTNKLFACDMCEFITGTEKNIKSHMVQYHSESKLYQCSKCSYVTKDLELIESHLESHLKPTDHKMTPIPPKVAISEGNLQTILNSVHAPVLIKCSECGYTAGDRENMKSHMIQHIQNKTSEICTSKPKVIQPTLPQKASYKCTDCSFVSIEATAFIHHMLVHKTVAKEKVDAQNLYNIKPVSKENTYKTSNAPFYHDERTGRFVCTICGYGCEYQRTIKSHIWKHSGNKDIVYPIFHNGPLSVYEDNVSRSQPDTSLKSAPAVEVQTVANSSDQQIAPGTTICKIKISEDKMIAYMKEKMKPPIKLHEFSRMENRKPVFTNSVLRNDPKELAVVVEVVRAVPCTQGLTGMASQHNSPKRSLSPASAVEPEPKKLKVTTEEFVELELQQEETKDEKVKAGTELPNIMTLDNKPTSEYKEPTESALALLALQKDQETSPVRAPFHNTRSRGSGQKRKMHNEISQEFIHCEKPDLISNVVQEVPEEHPELDVAEELVSSDQGSQSKSGGAGGICSSLLAVIEQLRERSKSDVDVENYSIKATGSGRRTSSRRRSRRDSSDDEMPSEFADTIEKILEDGEPRYRCKFCHYSNTKPLLLRIHMRLHKSKTPFECSLCDFVARSMEGLQMHMIMHCKVRTYQCKLCPSAFNYKSQLRAHMRAHNEKDTYICDFCDFITSNCTAYRQHTLIHTDAVRPLSCPNCHKKFSSKYSLLQHVCVSGHGDSVDEEQDLSSGDEAAQASKELKCPHCEFSSIDISEFTTHMGIHTDEEIMPVPLKCELCDFTAVSNRSLKSHMKRHINDQRYVQQPLEQYKCNLCGYVCHHLPSLKSHMWRHASDRNYSYEFTNDVINAAIDYDIRVDGQDINDPEILERVLNSERKIVEGRLNNTEQPGGKMPVCWVTFRCCQCGFETINKPELNVHMRSHSDIIQQTLNISQSDRMKDDIENSESQTEVMPNP